MAKGTGHQSGLSQKDRAGEVRDGSQFGLPLSGYGASSSVATEGWEQEREEEQPVRDSAFQLLDNSQIILITKHSTRLIQRLQKETTFSYLYTTYQFLETEKYSNPPHPPKNKLVVISIES